METGVLYNFLLTHLLLVKLTSSFHYNAGHTYKMQEMVKELTLKNHSNNGLAILHGIKLLPGRYTELINPFSSDAYQSYNIIMQVIATKSLHIYNTGAMNLLHGNKFSPWEDFFVNPFVSDVINPNQLCKCCTHISTGTGGSVYSGTMKRFNCFIN